PGRQAQSTDGMSVSATRCSGGNREAGVSRSCDRGFWNRYWMHGVLQISIRESMSVPFGTKVITALVGVLIVLTPASAGDSGLNATNCGSLTPQQCRAGEILRAQLMLQSARVYAAQPQLTAPSLGRVYGGSNVAQPSRGASRQKLIRK